ncbi:MAG: hypothetical protein C0407_13820, partial [Desulfobacca sp.]|nr:hypothetical protein [Desulfobacca sp.]
MEEPDVYQRLAEHLSTLGMGYPVREALLEILKESLTPSEAEIALTFPTNRIPLSPVGIAEIAKGVTLSRDELEAVLEDLTRKGFLFAGQTPEGEKGYAWHHIGFGFPQSFFWKGEDSPQSRKMAQLVGEYFNRQVTQEAYGSPIKQYRYIPVGKAVKAELQAVFPVQLMEEVIAQARRIAVAHCPCRVSYRLAGRGCEH